MDSTYRLKNLQTSVATDFYFTEIAQHSIQTEPIHQTDLFTIYRDETTCEDAHFCWIIHENIYGRTFQVIFEATSISKTEIENLLLTIYVQNGTLQFSPETVPDQDWITNKEIRQKIDISEVFLNQLSRYWAEIDVIEKETDLNQASIILLDHSNYYLEFKLDSQNLAGTMALFFTSEDEPLIAIQYTRCDKESVRKFSILRERVGLYKDVSKVFLPADISEKIDHDRSFTEFVIPQIGTDLIVRNPSEGFERILKWRNDRFE